MIEVQVRVIEANSATGKRIVKVTETNSKTGGTITKYVTHAPSHLVPARVNGRFSKTKTSAPCADPAKATGWMVEGHFETLAAARQSIGINTSPKRPNAVAAALKLAA